MKKLIVCYDGTSNTPDQLIGAVPVPTNVFRLFNAVAEGDGEIGQRKYYHPGVGTYCGLWARFLGNSQGYGLEKNIKSGYKWLTDNYSCGDRIYLFGFSRGALTANCLTHLIDRCGLLDPAAVTGDFWRRLEKDYRCFYRRGKGKKAPDKSCFADQQPGRGKVDFLGLWDMVGALGAPDLFPVINLIFDRPSRYRHHSPDLCANVRVAFHALSLDDKRSSFTPLRWTNIDPDRARECWFPGAHADVGGGYAEKGLSDGALIWMIRQAKQHGLKFVPEIGSRKKRFRRLRQIAPDWCGPIHDSFAASSIFKRLGSQPRSIPEIRTDNPLLHVAAIKRHRRRLIAYQPYYPLRELAVGGTTDYFPVYARDYWNWTGIYIHPGEVYALELSGTWLWKKMRYNADGRRLEPWWRQACRLTGLAAANLLAWLGRLMLQ
ncbi:MAG: DUF2235 domain-containing protein, partial [Victivallales bacterium]|nr:DUF2235 domain-containing protein [Victivallales bacterium]